MCQAPNPEPSPFKTDQRPPKASRRRQGQDHANTNVAQGQVSPCPSTPTALHNADHASNGKRFRRSVRETWAKRPSGDKCGNVLLIILFVIIGIVMALLLFICGWALLDIIGDAIKKGRMAN
ncbi:hypothetical protein IMZ48_22905 [Candidatus Bathyarchaeota archaeon]|nr:hypothetical protein [Candidatus Bathyarchaeota archaeon]